MSDAVLPENIDIALVKEWSAHDIVELYKAGNWWLDSYDPAGIAPLIRGSFAFVVAAERTTGKAVGMGRAISDGVSDAWLQDVVVLPEYRGRGIGRAIIRKLLDTCLDAGLVWVGLVAEPGTRDFYRPLGFRNLEGEPMVYMRE